MKLKYLPEYHLLKRLPLETWMNFIVLKYDEPPPSAKEMFTDCFNWIGRISQTVKVHNVGSLVWFGRVEDRDDCDHYVPRHLHVLLGHKHITTRTVHGSNLKLWTGSWGRELHFANLWEHGASYVKPFDASLGDGVGYVCKDNSTCQDTFFSTGLKKLIKELPNEN